LQPVVMNIANADEYCRAVYDDDDANIGSAVMQGI